MGQIRSRRQKYESTKSKHGMKVEQGCLIDKLSDDALLKIFSYISLYDKGRVARTCKRWKTLTKQAQLWQTIDFWEPLDRIAPCTDKWTYPYLDKRCAYRTLKILKTYSYASLRRVYLRVANRKIMRYLANNSPHLLTLSLLSSTQSESFCARDIIEFFRQNNFVLPHSLEQLQLPFMANDLAACGSRHTEPENTRFYVVSLTKFSQVVLPILIQCQTLRHLTLKQCILGEEDVETLTSGLPNLEEIWLLDFITEPYITSTLRGILRRITTNLQELTSLRFMPEYYTVLRSEIPIYCIDNLLQDLSQTKRLRELRVRNAIFSPDAFQLMSRSIDGLEELELWNCKSVTDEIMQIIARNLSSLKVLELPYSRFDTDKGLRGVKDHFELFHGRKLLSDYEYRGHRRSQVIDALDHQPGEIDQEQEYDPYENDGVIRCNLFPVDGVW